LDHTNTKNVQAILCQGTSFIKANNIKFSTHVDPLGTDAEDLLLSQSRQGEICSNSQGSWKGWWNNYCDEI